MACNSLDPAGAAASKVFNTAELLGAILGHLDTKPFVMLRMAYPRALSVAKAYPSLRSRFFLERDYSTVRKWIHVNPICKIILSMMGWRIYGIIKLPYSPPLTLDRQGLVIPEKLSIIVDQRGRAQSFTRAEVQILEDMLPHMHLSQQEIAMEVVFYGKNEVPARVGNRDNTFPVTSLEEFMEVVKLRAENGLAEGERNPLLGVDLDRTEIRGQDVEDPDITEWTSHINPFLDLGPTSREVEDKETTAEV